MLDTLPHRTFRSAPPALVVILTLLVAPATSAQVFFDTLGLAGDVYDDTDVVSFVGDFSGTVVGSDWFQGFRFESAATGSLGSIDVAVGNWEAGPETMEFRLYADAGGALGPLLATIFVEAVAEDFDGTVRRGRVASPGSAPVLVQGTSYWLMATAPGPTIWFNAEPGQSLPRLWTPGGVGGALNSDLASAAAFRVNGPPPVPIGAPFGTLLLGVSLVAVSARRLATM